MSLDEQGNKKVFLNNLVLYISLLLLVLCSYWRRVILLDDTFGYDQGIHIILARLWAAGYTPYEEIFVSYPPLFIWSLGIPWKLFNQASALQLLMSTYALAGVVALVYLGWVYHSRMAGIAAGVLLSFNPTYLDHSIRIMGETPSIGIAVVAIAFAERYRRGGGWVWLVLAGGALAASLSLKILPFYAGPFVGFIIISRYIKTGSWTNFLGHLQASRWLLGRDLAILSLSFLVAFLLPVIFFDPVALYKQVVGMRLVSRETQLNLFKSNNQDIINFIFNNSGLTTLALYGFIFVVARNLRTYWLLWVWFIVIWTSMYFLVPLRGKHLPIFLPTLALFSGFAIGHIFDTLTSFRKQRWSLQSLSMVLVILTALTIFGWDLTNVIAGDDVPALDGTLSLDDIPSVDDPISVEGENEEQVARRQEALKFIDKIAAPTDCVIADNPVFLYHTQRLPPPELSEVSQTRIETGFLTLKDIVQSIETHKCHVVAVLTPRFNQEMPGLSEWLTDNYLGIYRHAEISVYFAKKEPNGAYTPLSNHSFGGIVGLHGVHLNKQSWANKEDVVFISLFWQLEAPLQGNYIEKISLRDSINSKQLSQTTRLPFEGQFNPAFWHINEQARDTFWLNLPADLPAGTYDLYLSLCMPRIEQCLPINNDPGQLELYLGQIKVTS